jgi:hypothetical protein
MQDQSDALGRDFHETGQHEFSELAGEHDAAVPAARHARDFMFTRVEDTPFAGIVDDQAMFILEIRITKIRNT